MYNSESRPYFESDPSSKYGFFCDIEEETEIVKYYVIRKSENREITYEVKRSIAKSPSMSYLTMHRCAELHPGYSSERLCIAVAVAAAAEEDDPSSFMDNLKYRAKSSYKKYKSKFRACFYSAIVCSLFIVSVYISVIMPIQ